MRALKSKKTINLITKKEKVELSSKFKFEIARKKRFSAKYYQETFIEIDGLLYLQLSTLFFLFLCLLPSNCFLLFYSKKNKTNDFPNGAVII